jgi:hypothetical protein
MKKVRTKGVFLDLLPTKGKRADWESFVYELQQFAFNNSSVSELINQYINLVEEAYFQSKMRDASNLELRIMQKLCSIDPQVSLSPIKQFRAGEQVEYVVARSPFVEFEKTRQELRIYLGRLDEFGKTIPQLSEDTKFMAMAKQKMKTEMEKIIAGTEKTFKKSGK